MSYPKLEHNRFVVNDLDRSIEFYQSLGFKIKWDGYQPSGNRWVHIHLGEFYLSISQRSHKERIREVPDDYKEMYGYQHMGWVVDNIKGFRKKLDTLRIIYNKVETEVGFHSYFFDPDNNEIELIEYKK